MQDPALLEQARTQRGAQRATQVGRDSVQSRQAAAPGDSCMSTPNCRMTAPARWPSPTEPSPERVRRAGTLDTRQLQQSLLGNERSEYPTPSRPARWS